MSASREISGTSDWKRIVFGRYAGHVHFEQHDCRALKNLAKFLRQRNKEDNDAHLQRVGDIPNNLIAQLVISFDIMERAGYDPNTMRRQEPISHRIASTPTYGAPPLGRNSTNSRARHCHHNHHRCPAAANAAAIACS